MKIGCQTYSWEMQLKERPTTLWQMLDAVKTAGFQGVEFTNNTGVEWLNDPERVQKELKARDLKLVALTIARNGYTDPLKYDSDMRLIETAIKFLKKFPGTYLTLTGATHSDQKNWKVHLDQAIKLYNEAAEKAHKNSIRCCIHPHSHHGSLLQTEEQYDYLFANLTKNAGWCPDVGHIVRGGQDLITCLDRYFKYIVYCHMKDVDKADEWQVLGKGKIDYKGFFSWLKKHNFDGWLVAEEESKLAWKDPLIANIENMKYLKRIL